MTYPSKEKRRRVKRVKLPSREDYLAAARLADWGQVVMNGGPPCFHLEDGRFCLRAQRWGGHEHPKEFHAFTSLDGMLARHAADAAIQAIEEYEERTGD